MAPSAAETRKNDGRSRLQLIVAGGVGLAAASPLLRGLLGIGAADAASKSEDLRILQLVRLLEYTQVAFYEQALAQAGLKGELRDFAQTALGHERAHLAAVEQRARTERSAPSPASNSATRRRAPIGSGTRRSSSRTSRSRATTARPPNLTKPTLARPRRSSRSRPVTPPGRGRSQTRSRHPTRLTSR